MKIRNKFILLMTVLTISAMSVLAGVLSFSAHQQANLFVKKEAEEHLISIREIKKT